MTGPALPRVVRTDLLPADGLSYALEALVAYRDGRVLLSIAHAEASREEVGRDDLALLLLLRSEAASVAEMIGRPEALPLGARGDVARPRPDDLAAWADAEAAEIRRRHLGGAGITSGGAADVLRGIFDHHAPASPLRYAIRADVALRPYGVELTPRVRVCETDRRDDLRALLVLLRAAAAETLEDLLLGFGPESAPSARREIIAWADRGVAAIVRATGRVPVAPPGPPRWAPPRTPWTPLPPARRRRPA